MVSEFFNNIWFFIILAAEFALQWCIVEYLNFIFRTQPLTWVMHITCLSFGIGSVLVDLLVKKLMAKDQEKLQKYFEIDFNETDAPGKYNDLISRGFREANELQRSKT